MALCAGAGRPRPGFAATLARAAAPLRATTARAGQRAPALRSSAPGCGRRCLLPLLKNFRWSVFFRLDLESTARAFAAARRRCPSCTSTTTTSPCGWSTTRCSARAVLRHRSEPGWEKFEANAFARLREMIVHEAQLSPARPRRKVLDDQIVWARSPVRLDLAGGWTDTPPYCIEYGGQVLNVAVDLNGQPPIQVFAKLSRATRTGHALD